MLPYFTGYVRISVRHAKRGDALSRSIIKVEISPLDKCISNYIQ